MPAEPAPPPPAPLNDPRILGPIPTPPAQKWREVRLIYLPRAAFALGIVVAAWLWTQYVVPATLVAEAELTGADVRATQAGYVADLKVDLLHSVKAGQVLGAISPSNPRLLDATLAVIRADVGMLTDTMAGATDKQRVAQNFERVQLDSLKARVELASLQARLQLAESDLGRFAPLHKAGLISDQDFEQRQNDRDSLAAQVGEETKLVAHYEEVLRNATKPEALSSDQALAAAIKVQDAKLKLAEAQLTPLPLIAPLDGVVSMVSRHVGEAVNPGDVILHINSPKSERLVGYLRAPLPVEPKPGMLATVTTRGEKRVSATTRVTGVGPALEAIPGSLLAAMRLPTNPPPEHALQVVLEMPRDFPLRPGEHVDVSLK